MAARYRVDEGVIGSTRSLDGTRVSRFREGPDPVGVFAPMPSRAGTENDALAGSGDTSQATRPSRLCRASRVFAERRQKRQSGSTRDVGKSG